MDPASTPAASEPKPPPGYVQVERAPAPASVALPVAAFVVLGAAAAVAQVNEVVVRQPQLYLVSGTSPGTGVAALAALAGAAAGLLLPAGKDARSRLGFLVAAAASVLALSGAAWFFAFGRGITLWLPATALPFLVAALVTHAAKLARAALGVAVARLGVLEYLLSPFRLLGIAVVLGAAASAEATVGPLRAGALLGMATAALSGFCPSLFAFVDGQPIAAPRATRWTAASALLLGGGLLAASQRWVPVGSVPSFVNTVIYAEQGERQSLMVTSGQDALELFVDGRLKVSMVDQRRYFEALVQPVLAASERHDRVLLIGGGSGMAERELLRHDDVGQITVVLLDDALPRLARRLRWTRELSEGALASPKLRFVENEGIVWLSDNDERFDVIVVDLPDPLDYLDAKSYSVHFYRLLARHLAPGGVAAVQATSAFYSPRTFDAIRASMNAAGLSTREYHAPVPTFGDWGFILGRSDGVVPRIDAERLSPWLHGVTVQELELLPPDVQPPEPSPENLLYDMSMVEIFAEERHEAGL